MSSEFGGHHFFGPDDKIFYVGQVFYLKFANMNLESSFFQQPTPAGTGIMVGPGNDTRDSHFILPVPCPCVSQRKIKIPETGPGSSIKMSCL